MRFKLRDVDTVSYIGFRQGFILRENPLEKSQSAVYIWSFRKVLKYVITLIRLVGRNWLSFIRIENYGDRGYAGNMDGIPGVRVRVPPSLIK